MFDKQPEFHRARIHAVSGRDKHSLPTACGACVELFPLLLRAEGHENANLTEKNQAENAAAKISFVGGREPLYWHADRFPTPLFPMSCETDGIVQQLLKSYTEIGGINHLDGTNLPSRDAMPAICTGLLSLVFPGFFDDEPLTSACVEKQTRREIDILIGRMTTEMERSLRSLPASAQDARALTCSFLRYLPEVRTLLLTDVEAAYEGDPAARSYEEIILSYPCIEAIAIQRMAHWLYARHVPLLPRMMTEWTHSRTGIDIHPGAQIGPYFFIDHGTGVVIGETCVIGKHVKLYHGVTLGAKSFAKDDAGHIIKGRKRHPNVEDHVTIYPNATILGGETTIGTHSTIGANVHLDSSVPPYSVISLGEQGHRVLDKRNKPKRTAAIPA